MYFELVMVICMFSCMQTQEFGDKEFEREGLGGELIDPRGVFNTKILM